MMMYPIAPFRPKVEFVYMPRMGDYVFAPGFRIGHGALPLALVCHQNGCRHIAWAEPGMCRLSYPCSSRRWREEARLVIEQYLDSYRGIAWDERGEITVVVTAAVAWDLVHSLMQLGGEAPTPSNQLGIALVLGGAATIAVSQHPYYEHPVLVRAAAPDPVPLQWEGPVDVHPGAVDAPPRVEYQLWSCDRECDPETLVARQTVPAGWAPYIEQWSTIPRKAAEPEVPEPEEVVEA